MGKLDGKVAIVTGGSSGIGLATGQRFAEEGAKVYLFARREAELKAAVNKIGHGAVGVHGDAANAGDVARLYETVKADGNRVQVIFQSIGASEYAPLADITEDHIDRIFGSNVKCTVNTVQQALPLLDDGASIVLVSSMMSTSTTGMVGIGMYAASKAAVRSLVRSWALEMKGRNIRVNALAPGPTLTPAVYGFIGGDEESQKRYVAETGAKFPLGRYGDPAEQAAAALFLASSESSYITGHELVADGGITEL
jgi:NAD(P)-dependent dehydrogenase (short-subunit alcohol dehydrogenase family)